ncbi:MAG: oxygenase MpaB family protein [Polyangiales bacterium]
MAPQGDRIPTEFRYWDNLPRAQRMRRALRLVFGADPQLPDETVRKWAHGYFDADPIAEQFVDEVYLKRGQSVGRAMVDQALANGVDSVADAPASLRRLFAELEVAPAWLDMQTVALGARVFRRFGTHMHSFAGAITLEGYRESSVAKPLAFTGAYNGESASKRFLETASFWIDVSEPEGLLPGRPGRATALRVRLMHVFVRRRLLAHPRWDLAAWGVPISQSDALLTLMGGSFVPGYGLKVLGYRTSREEIEAMMHFWRYVGHLMGVQPRWYPANVDEALGLMFASQVKGARMSGTDGVELARSYVASYAPTPNDTGRDAWIKRFEHGLQIGYTSWFVPPDTYSYYGLPSPGLWRLHPLAQLPFVFARETVRKNVPAVDEWLDQRVRRATKDWVRARLGKRRAEYHAVEQLTR